MKVKTITLENFKRFTYLSLDQIPQEAKLVLLIGANGSGKSSMLDAFACMENIYQQDTHLDTKFFQYYKKDKQVPFKLHIEKYQGITFDFDSDNKLQDYATSPTRHQNSFYGRSSFRQVSRLTRIAGAFDADMNEETLPRNRDRPKFLIDKDIRFENDIEKLSKDIFLSIFNKKFQTIQQITNKYIEPINDAFERIFGNKHKKSLSLTEIIPPLDQQTAQITFCKGDVLIPYDYLSAGEKEVFNLLLNLLSRTEMYPDSIYFFDEMDLHLNTHIQYNLLKEITENWIPENSQLWTASHSLGFIQYAKESTQAVIFDFDDYDYDMPKTLLPEPKDNPEIYEIAVGKHFLDSLFRGMHLFFVEGKDSVYYAQLSIEKTIFIPAQTRNDVYHKTRSSSEYKGLVDRDFLTNEDIQLIRKHYPNLYVLEYYSIENYLYHPNNLEEYYTHTAKSFEKTTYIQKITQAKNELKNKLMGTFSLKRTEYPYFGETNEKDLQHLANRFKNKGENEAQTEQLVDAISSDDFETFYKILPMKTYCTDLSERQHIRKSELAKTKWFMQKIQEILGK